LSRRYYYPYAPWEKINDVHQHEMMPEVFIAIVQSFIECSKNDWIEPKTIEHAVFNKLKMCYRVHLVLGTDHYRLRNVMYTLFDTMIEDNVIYTQPGNGWKYPRLKMNFISLWRLRYTEFGDYFFKA
jgi:hypothetical protein